MLVLSICFEWLQDFNLLDNIFLHTNASKPYYHYNNSATSPIKPVILFNTFTIQNHYRVANT